MSKIEEMIRDRDFVYLEPYFYNNRWALRCELGIGDKEKFDISAKRRAVEIYNILFPNGADAVIFNYWVNDFSEVAEGYVEAFDDDVLSKWLEWFIEQETDQLRFLFEYQSKYRHTVLKWLETYDEDDMPIRNRVICYSDGRKFDTDDIIDRQIGERFDHEISFVSFENECILSIYDSRGCDIVFATHEKLKEFYHTLEPYFLDYDRAEMERRYNEGE